MVTKGKNLKTFSKKFNGLIFMGVFPTGRFAIIAIITLIWIVISAGVVTAIQNTAPSASRYNPSSSSVFLAAKQIQTFTVRGTDLDGNLRGTKWYLNGNYQTSHFTLTGSSGTDSWSHTFNTTGKYTVEALVFDSQNAYSSSVAWTVTVDSASITSFSSSTGTKNPGNSISSSVAIKNTGVNTRSYWVGLSYQKPDGTWYNIPAQQTISLSPNSQQTLTFNWVLPSSALSGTYNARVAIWNNYNTSTNLMVRPKYDQKDATSAFIVTSKPFKFKSRALYVWGETYTILENSAEADSLIQFAKRHGINTLFFYTDRLKLSSSPQQFKSFIAKAHNNNLYINALYGDATWTTNHQSAIDYTNAIISYNKNSQINEKFDGVHLDVEPYELGSWEKDSSGNSLTLAQSPTNKNLAIQYLQLYSSIKSTISAGGEVMTFGVDIPFWFDADGFGLVYNGNSKLLSSHVQDIADFVTIMDYTDNYNNAIAWAANEVNYGVTTGKYVTIAFETQKLSYPGSTFYEEGATALEYAIAQVNKSFSAKPSFKGFAIHHYGSYKILSGVT